MPAMGGPALARKLKPVRPGLKVMFMSGYADATPGDRDVLDEPTLFLQKPFALERARATRSAKRSISQRVADADGRKRRERPSDQIANAPRYFQCQGSQRGAAR